MLTCTNAQTAEPRVDEPLAGNLRHESSRTPLIAYRPFLYTPNPPPPKSRATDVVDQSLRDAESHGIPEQWRVRPHEAQSVAEAAGGLAKMRKGM